MAHSPSKIRDVAAAIVKLVKPNEEEWQNKNAHHSFIRAEGSIDPGCTKMKHDRFFDLLESIGANELGFAAASEWLSKNGSRVNKRLFSNRYTNTHRPNGAFVNIYKKDHENGMMIHVDSDSTKVSDEEGI